MNRADWELPEVPENVHQAVLEVLEKLDTVAEDSERKTDMRGKKYKKHVIVLIAAVMTAILGTTVLATELFSWNERAEEIFDGGGELQDKLAEEEFARDESVSVTKNGLTITSLQTIQDENCFYTLFEVKAEDPSIVIEENSDMKYTIDWGGEEDPFSMRESRFIKKEDQGNSGYFEIYGGKSDKTNTEDIVMNVHFTALQKQGGKAEVGEDVLTGEWDFSITIHQTPGTNYQVEKECQIAGYSVLVHEVRISPLTVTVICDGENMKVMERGEGICLDQCDSLPVWVSGLNYQDGTILTQRNRKMTEGYNDEGDYFMTQRFSSVVEVEKVRAILLGEDMAEVGVLQTEN